MTEVVILPGLDGTGRMHLAFCSALERLGISSQAIGYPTNQTLGYDELEKLVRTRLPAAVPFVLLGESFSGPLALRIAANPPVGMRGLVLSTTFARMPVPVLAPLAPLLRIAPSRVPMSLLCWWLLGRWVTKELKLELASALRTVDPRVLRARAEAALKADAMALLPEVHMPVLQLVALEDRLLASSKSRELATGLPSVHSKPVLGPHLLLQACPRACAEAVAGFAAGLLPAR